MGSGNSKRRVAPAPTSPTEVTADTAGAEAKLENLMVYMRARIGEKTTGGLVAVSGALAALTAQKGYEPVARVLTVSDHGLPGDTMPYAVVLLLSENAHYTTPMVSASDAYTASAEGVVDAALASQMLGWSADYSAAGAQILSEVMQTYPAANRMRNNVYLVRVFNQDPLTSNFLSFGWLIGEGSSPAPYHIQIAGDGGDASVSPDGKVMTLAQNEITKQALILACFAEDTLVKGVGWCTACDLAGKTLDEADIVPQLTDFKSKLYAASIPGTATDEESHAFTIFKFSCPIVNFTSGEAVGVSDTRCRSVGFLVRRPITDSANVQYYVMVEGGAYFVTAAILKVAGETGSALSWNWPSSTTPIIPTDIYDKPYVYGAISQEMEGQYISGMQGVISAMKQVDEPCTTLTEDTILSLATTLFEKGFVYDSEPLTVTGAAQQSVLQGKTSIEDLQPAVQAAMKSLTPGTAASSS